MLRYTHKQSNASTDKEPERCGGKQTFTKIEAQWFPILQRPVERERERIVDRGDEREEIEMGSEKEKGNFSLLDEEQDDVDWY